MNLRSRFLIYSLAGIAFILSAQLWAQSEIELEGAITNVNGSKIELFDGLVSVEVHGAKIDTDDENSINISDMKVGTAVEITGTVGADGTIRAKSLEVSEEKKQDAEIEGVIGNVDDTARMFTIGPVPITWTQTTKFKDMSRPVAGQLVEVELEVSSDRLVASVVEKKEADD